LSPSLLTGQADAVIGAFRNFELNQMDIEKRPGRAFYVEEHGIPAYGELILVANKDRRNDSKLRHFVDALEEGVQYLINHPDESWKLFINGERKNLDDELNRRAWRGIPCHVLRSGPVPWVTGDIAVSPSFCRSRELCSMFQPWQSGLLNFDEGRSFHCRRVF
jgi:putative hydroxymethylpyrimidine transport system substrate-binding protein